MGIPGIKLQEKGKKSPMRLGITGKEGTGKSSVARLLKGKKLIDDMELKLPLEVTSDPNCHVVEFDGDITFDKQIDMLKSLYKADKLPVEWLVIDSTTSLEKAVHRHTLVKEFGDDPKKFADYGTGFKASQLNFDRVLELLKRIETKHGTNTLFIIHATVKMCKNPLGDDFSKLVPSLTESGADSLLRHLHYNGVIIDEVEVKKEGMGKKAGKSERLISFDNTSALYSAKSMRQDIPKKVPFDIDGKWLGLTINKETR